MEANVDVTGTNQSMSELNLGHLWVVCSLGVSFFFSLTSHSPLYSVKVKKTIK